MLLFLYFLQREALLQLEERKRFPLEQRLRQFIVGQQGAINTVAAGMNTYYFMYNIFKFVFKHIFIFVFFNYF